MKSLDIHQLPVQLVLTFLTVVVITTALVGLPAIWLMQSQLDQQAWNQVEQAERTALSFYANKVYELENAASLTAKRPTLTNLLDQGSWDSLQDYLITLQQGAALDLIQVCISGELAVSTDKQISLCDQPESLGFYQNLGDPWLIARTDLEGTDPGEVIVGIKLDREFAQEIKDQIGLDQALIFENNILSSSFDLEGVQGDDLVQCLENKQSQDARLVCPIGSMIHNLTIRPVDSSGYFVLVALDLSDIASARQRLLIWMIVTMVGIAGITTLLGVILSRRISRPLIKLSSAAGSFSRGDLESPVDTESKVLEITRVAKALDDARIDLKKMLRSLREERDWSENLLSSIMEAIITLDEEGGITFFSHGAERLTGLRNSDVLGSQIDAVFPPADPASKISTILAAAKEEDGYQKVDAVLVGDQVTSLAITSADLNRSGAERKETALVIRDISEEESVRRLLGHFFANVTHELRTPLTALEASIEMLMDEEADLKQDEISQLYTSLHLGIFRLHNLVDNLLESANIEARRFRISPRNTDLPPIVAEAVQTMQPLLLKYDQRLSADLPANLPHVKADKRRIVQVLINLISNANRYGPPGELIELVLNVQEDFVRLAVLDRGPGVSAEQRENLFDRFVYPHARSEISQAGTGLGLSVVKAIVKAHGGDVGFEDRPGGGSMFWFTLPAVSED